MIYFVLRCASNTQLAVNDFQQPNTLVRQTMLKTKFTISFDFSRTDSFDQLPKFYSDNQVVFNIVYNS